MRGELISIVVTDGKDDGSSPHAWGTRRACLERERLDRFIPTCVGNSEVHTDRIFIRSVHPHMRGELLWMSATASVSFGSSPHAWGTLPAPTRLTLSLAVHPHMRGELVTASLEYVAMTGSSPHAWGTLQGGQRREHEQRFIPTCVGNSRGRSDWPQVRSVHPHMRGELRTYR